MNYEKQRARDLKRIMDRKPGAAGSLDRLHDYVEDIFNMSATSLVCGDCNADVECDECEIDTISQLEYDIQTEVINFAEQLLNDWQSMNN